jgi:exodeoxyribonuclease V alpha subunit
MEELEQLEGRVERLFYQTGNFCTGLLRTAAEEPKKFSVKSYVDLNQEVKILGKWGTYRGRPSFEGIGLIPELPEDPEGLVKWLAVNKSFFGIGPSKAQLIVEAAGSVDEFDQLIRTNDGLLKLSILTNIKTEILLGIQTEWVTDHGMNAALIGLAKFGIGARVIKRIVQILGPDAYSKIEEDPYILSEAIPGYGFKKADAIARNHLDIPPDSGKRIHAAFLYVLRLGADDGHTCMLVDDIVRESFKILNTSGYDPGWSDLEERLTSLEDVVQREVDGELYIQHQVFAFQEDYLHRLFHDNKNKTLQYEVDLEKLTLGAVEAQSAGIEAAVRKPISVVTGSAGTGKTWTITRICEAAESLGKMAVLLAPTGKAADRMREVTGRAAGTIHSLLWFDGANFHAEPENLPQNAVYIVDEVSMCNVSLTWNLLSRINFNTSSLVLVGDHHQLPPIGPGCPLRDVIGKDLTKVTRLTTIHRQTGLLKRNCNLLLDGHVAQENTDLYDDIGTFYRQPGKFAPWYVVDLLNDPNDVLEVILDLFSPDLFANTGIEMGDLRILTPMRNKERGMLSLTMLNARIQEVVQRDFHGVDCYNRDEDIHKTGGPPAMVYDPVIYRKNDRGLGIWNGSTGTVLEVNHKKDTIIADFGTEDHPHPVTLKEGKQQFLEVGYASSIHQSQGSEFPISVVVMHSSQIFMHHRHLLYTACTRSRETCILLGDQRGINYAARNVKPSDRQTWLSLNRGSSTAPGNGEGNADSDY